MGIDAHRPKPIMIKSIELEGIIIWRLRSSIFIEAYFDILQNGISFPGVGYTSSCNPCPPGFFSDSKASKTCYPCKRDYVSSHKSATCTECDKSEFYAEPGSSQCTPRPACTASDFYSVHAPCDGNNQVNGNMTLELEFFLLNDKPHFCCFFAKDSSDLQMDRAKNLPGNKERGCGATTIRSSTRVSPLQSRDRVPRWQLPTLLIKLFLGWFNPMHSLSGKHGP